MIKQKRYADMFQKKLLWFLLLVIFVLFKYILIVRHEVELFSGLSMLLLMLYIVSSKGKIAFRWTIYHSYMIGFTGFAYLSSFWALRPSYTVGRGHTLLLVCVLMFMVFINIQRHMDVHFLLKSIMIGGYIVCIISIFYYGISNIVAALTTSMRLNDELINSNDIGMVAAYSLLINIYMFSKKEKHWYSILSIPAMIMLVASESRKAILIIGVGLLLYLIFRGLRGKDPAKKIGKFFLIISVSALVLFILLQLPFLSRVKERFILMNNALLGNSGDQSTETRMNLIEIGNQIFEEHKILGIGINNAQFVVEGFLHRENYYLHNNFIELLADGGIIGFIIYYSLFVYLIFMFFKRRNFSDNEFNICLVLLILHVIMDVGTVSFLDRVTYFYLLVFYFKSRQLKNSKKILLKEKILPDIS